MSLDLAVWPEPAVVTAEEAARKCERFAEREPGAVPADSRTLVFHRELTARYPNLTDLPAEHREGGPDRHFRAEVADRSLILRAFTGFVAGEDSWWQASEWYRTEF